MKKFPKHIIFLISATLLYGCSYASPAVDSVPACILKMKQKDSLLIVDKYDYKGQQWFCLRRMLTLKESQISDQMYHLEFYNKDCKLVCTQVKGGIAGLNKVKPDSIDKTKIVKVTDEKVPEKIMLLAIKNNAASITEYEYQGQTLYFLFKEKDRKAQKMMIVIEPYYDKTGTEIMRFKRANDPSFFRAQGWDPHTIQPEKLVQKSTIWFNPSKEKLK
ncbi:MAG: hypothetical protein WKF91_00315 [Segetibacter sp.]